MENKKESSNSINELLRLIDIVKDCHSFLISKIRIILLLTIFGAMVGLVLSFVIKPKYTAKMSVALIEKNGSGGLADLASNFGLSGLMGSGTNGAFSGDNLLEILKSRKAVELALMSPVKKNNKNITLMEYYLDFMGISSKFKKSNNIKLRNLTYEINQDNKSFTRLQDSVLLSVYSDFIDKNLLDVRRKDKKISIVYVEFTSKDELFSKLFVESLMEKTYDFYKQTKTLQIKRNVDIVQAKADSVKELYEKALYKSASISTLNINQAFQTAAVPRLKQESDAKLYATVYAEILKNLETLKLDLERETPIVQVIDEPVLPLQKNRIGKIKGTLLGGITGCFVLLLYFFVLYNFKRIKNTIKNLEQNSI